MTESLMRPDVTAVLERLPRGDRPSKEILAFLSQAVDSSCEPDDQVTAYVRGNITPVIHWILSRRRFVRVEEGIRTRNYGSMDLDEISEVTTESAMAGWLMYCLSSDGSGYLDKIRCASQRASQNFALEVRRVKNPRMFELLDRVNFDCGIPPSVLSGTSGTGPITVGNTYSVGFASEIVVISDLIGPLVIFPEGEVIELALGGPEQVYTVEQIATQVLLRTAAASITFMNYQQLPQELYGYLLPELQRLSERGQAAVLSTAPGQFSLADELAKLAHLYEMGALNDVEYADAKGTLLNR